MNSVVLIEQPAKAQAYTGWLPSQKIQEMVAHREIFPSGILTDIEPDQIQPASIDLRLGDCAYPLDASFLPGKAMRVLEKMESVDPSYQKFALDLRQGAVLERGRPYLIPLAESIKLRSDVTAYANPKSSTGRLDILTRLIADRSALFDEVEEGYQDQLYLEVAPRSFSVVVRARTRLNQLRFKRTHGEAPKPITEAD